MIIPVDICNFALSNVGAFAGLQTVEIGSSKEAVACRAQYPLALKAALRDPDCDWGFARKTIQLALADLEPVGYTYAYKYPSDCIRALRIHNPAIEGDCVLTEYDYIRRKLKRIPFELGSDPSGNNKLILTNREQAVLVYTGFIDNPNMFDPLFAEALGYKLSAAFVPIFKANTNMQAFYLNQYEKSKARAAAAAANESAPEAEGSSDFEHARL